MSLNKKVEVCDILIVGGGPAGLSTFLHLQHYTPELANQVILIEKNRYPRDKLCGGAMSGWSELIYQQLNINLDIPSVWIDKVECRFEKQIDCVDQTRFFRVVQRKELDSELAKISVKRGLRLHENETFIDFIRKKNYVEVLTDKNRYKVKILIGADGALSKVRNKMNLHNQSNLAPMIEIFSPVNKRYDLEFEEKKIVFDYSQISSGLQGYVWHFPCIKDEQPYMNHGIGDFRVYKNRPKVNMKKIFQYELSKREIKRDIKSWSGYPIRWLSENDIISQPNIFLIGDAAGIEPCLGGGIHLALSYGELASIMIKNAFEQKNFTFENYRNSLNSHLLGKYIRKLTFLASEMYNGKILPGNVIREIFTKKR